VSAPVPAPRSTTSSPGRMAALATICSAQCESSRCQPHGRRPDTTHHEDRHHVCRLAAQHRRRDLIFGDCRMSATDLRYKEAAAETFAALCGETHRDSPLSDHIRGLVRGKNAAPDTGYTSECGSRGRFGEAYDPNDLMQKPT
jgi:hypothetical protein